MRRIAGVILVGMTLLSGCWDNAQRAEEQHAIVQNPQASAQQPQQPVAAQSTAALPPPPRISSPAPQPAIAVSPAPLVKSAPNGMDEIVAKVNGEPLVMRQLMRPLIEAHGLTVLLNLVQLELAKQDAAKSHVTVVPDDFDNERQATLERLFAGSDDAKLLDRLDKALAIQNNPKADKVILARNEANIKSLRAEMQSERESFLEQFLDKQHIDRVEFDIVLQINTYLRKIAEPQLVGRLDDAALRRAFGQMYGERLHVHYMELSDMPRVGDAKRRLLAGDRFEDIARDMSINRASADLGGDLPAFTRQSLNPPDNFKEVSFALKDGEVSDVVVIGKSYLLIKRIELIPPKHVKFEDVKENVYRTLSDRLLESVVKKLKQDLAAQAVKDMQIVEPILAKQLRDRQNKEVEAEKKAKDDLDRQQHLRDAMKANGNQPAPAEPGKGATNTPVAPPAAVKEASGGRPPATPPGRAASLDLPKLVPDAQSSTDPSQTNK